MRAAVMRDKKIVVDTVPEPEPGPGQVLVKTLACGICGSDLHMLKFADRMVEIGRRSGTPGGMDPTRDVVMGHEFCVEVLDHGENCSKTLKPGTRACSMPILLGSDGFNEAHTATREWRDDAPPLPNTVCGALLLLERPPMLCYTLDENWMPCVSCHSCPMS